MENKLGIFQQRHLMKDEITTHILLFFLHINIKIMQGRSLSAYDSYENERKLKDNINSAMTDKFSRREQSML
jgi:hypothetical protein